MRILDVTVVTSRLAAQRTFYGTTMGWPVVAETPASFTVQIGASRLSFLEDAKHTGPYHLAHAIPRNAVHSAGDWLRQRVPLLQKDGVDEIFFANINARSLYYCDADGNILEFIAHYNLDCELQGPFGPASVLHVSEIGLPVEDVGAFTTDLQRELGLEPYGGPVGADFAFMGDIAGCLVVVTAGRAWLPTETVRATISPVRLTLQGPRELQRTYSPYPYTVRVVTSETDFAGDDGQ